MVCPSCGQKVERKDRFCRSCGQSLQTKSAARQATKRIRQAAGQEELTRATETLRRRSIRVTLHVPVVIKWRSKLGVSQVEAAQTRVVNAHGCLLWMKADLAKNTKVEVLNNATGKVSQGRVAWIGGQTEDGHYKLSIELNEPDASFWGPEYGGFLVWATSESS